MKLDWQAHGGQGPTLLLVHGFLSSPRQWLLNLPGLTRHCRPVTVALHGHGGAPAPDQPTDYTPAAYGEAFERIRCELGVERWFVLGYSLGAGLTLQYTFRYPQRVIAHLFTNSTSALADHERVAEWRSGAEESARRIIEGGHAAMERIAVHPVHARRLPAPVFEALREDAGHHVPLGIANTLRYTNPLVSVRDRLEANPRPVRLICGQRERRFQPLRDAAAASMPGLEIIDLDAGHGMNMEAPDAFNDAVTTFLGRFRDQDGPSGQTSR